MPDLFTGERQRQSVEVAPGAIWLRNWLSLDRQLHLVARRRALLEGPGGGYTPTVRGGGKMHVQMMCLGRHWNPLTYTYESTRADHDNLPVAPVPDDWVELASAAARGGLRSDSRHLSDQLLPGRRADGSSPGQR